MTPTTDWREKLMELPRPERLDHDKFEVSFDKDELISFIAQTIEAEIKAQRAADYEAVKKAIKEQKPPVLAEFSEAASWNLEVRERLDDALAAIEAIYEQEAK